MWAPRKTLFRAKSTYLGYFFCWWERCVLERMWIKRNKECAWTTLTWSRDQWPWLRLLTTVDALITAGPLCSCGSGSSFYLFWLLGELLVRNVDRCWLLACGQRLPNGVELFTSTLTISSTHQTEYFGARRRPNSHCHSRSRFLRLVHDWIDRFRFRNVCLAAVVGLQCSHIDWHALMLPLLCPRFLLWPLSLQMWRNLVRNVPCPFKPIEMPLTVHFGPLW